MPKGGAFTNKPESCLVFKEHSPVWRSDERVSPLQRLVIFGGDAEVGWKTCISNAGINHSRCRRLFSPHVVTQTELVQNELLQPAAAAAAAVAAQPPNPISV